LFIVFREEKLPEGRAKKAKLAYMVLLFFLLVAWSAALIGEHLQFIAKIESESTKKKKRKGYAALHKNSELLEFGERYTLSNFIR
jgi:hypothetical protein